MAHATVHGHRQFKDSSKLTRPDHDQHVESSTAINKSLTALCRELGSCVYYIRTDDGLIKIGTTGDLSNRKRWYGSGWTRILAVERGGYVEEQIMVDRFAHCVARGREYFYPEPELIEHINQIRQRFGISPIAR